MTDEQLRQKAQQYQNIEACKAKLADDLQQLLKDNSLELMKGIFAAEHVKESMRRLISKANEQISGIKGEAVSQSHILTKEDEKILATRKKNEEGFFENDYIDCSEKIKYLVNKIRNQFNFYEHLKKDCHNRARKAIDDLIKEANILKQEIWEMLWNFDRKSYLTYTPELCLENIQLYKQYGKTEAKQIERILYDHFIIPFYKKYGISNYRNGSITSGKESHEVYIKFSKMLSNLHIKHFDLGG